MSTLIRRRIALAVSATWLGQAVRIGLNLAGLPIIFRFLGQEELGIWLILGQSSVVLSMLVDAGLTPTLTRRIAFAAGKTRAGAGHPLDEESRHELANLVKSAAISAMAAAQQAGQQRIAAAHRSAGHQSLAVGIVSDQALVPSELLPRDVSLVVIGEQHLPLCLRTTKATDDPLTPVPHAHRL